jgi:hypothetical protein
MKNKRVYKILSHVITMVVMLIFFVFSSGIMVTVHVCTESHDHICSTSRHSIYLLIHEHHHTGCESEECHACSSVDEEHSHCTMHSHCSLVSHLIKISDPIDLFNEPIVEISSVPASFEQMSTDIDRPSIRAGSPDFIHFISQRVLYA